MTTNKSQVNLSIPPDALDKLDTMAQAHLHSRNVEAEYLIRLAWQRFQQADKVDSMLPITFEAEGELVDNNPDEILRSGDRGF
jgi:hypothetical protein